MTYEWEGVIPTGLHETFIRQVEEAVSTELMQVFYNSEDSTGAQLDTEEIEEQLTTSFRTKYLELFQKGQWPPKASAQLGIRPTANEPHNWVCCNCKEKNQNSFETCQRCSEQRPDTKREPVTLPVSISRPAPTVTTQRQVSGWTCRECNIENGSELTVCSSCHQHLDPYKRTAWPSHSDAPEPTTSHEARMKLFHALRDEFDMDDPFSSIDISHEEFFQAMERLKRDLVVHNVPERDLVQLDAQEPAVAPAIDV